MMLDMTSYAQLAFRCCNRTSSSYNVLLGKATGVPSLSNFAGQDFLTVPGRCAVDTSWHSIQTHTTSV